MIHGAVRERRDDEIRAGGQQDLRLPPRGQHDQAEKQRCIHCAWTQRGEREASSRLQRQQRQPHQRRSAEEAT